MPIINTNNEFLYGEPVKIKDKKRFSWPGFINGKIKNISAYIVELECFVASVYETYGKPNRHLELEYGYFSGRDKEYIVLASEIERIK